MRSPSIREGATRSIQCSETHRGEEEERVSRGPLADLAGGGPQRVIRLMINHASSDVIVTTHL